MKIAFGSDHAGFSLAQTLMPFVRSLGHDVVYFGAHELDSGDDYVVYAVAVWMPDLKVVLFNEQGTSRIKNLHGKLG
jgi:ribose 5-phosphate isomerase RpiB